MTAVILPRKAITIKHPRERLTLVAVKRPCDRCAGSGEIPIDGGWMACSCRGELTDEWIGLDELADLLMRAGLVERRTQ